jgi:hypothetical protein
MTVQTICLGFGALLLAVGILGGGFEVKELKVPTVTPVARVASTVVGAVFAMVGIMLTISPSLPSMQSVAPATLMATASATMGQREQDTDRNGGDYMGFDIATAHVELCESACRDDPRCSAWTYVKPNLHGPKARCYLKQVQPETSSNNCCVSGAKLRRPTG